MRGMSYCMGAIVLAAGLLAGCDKTYKFTITNTSQVAREIEMKSPDGFQRLGVLAPGQSLRYDEKVPKDELPASFELRAGGLNKGFTLDDKDKDKQYLYIEENGIVGPLDENKEVKSSTRFQGRSSRSGGEVITGQPASPTAPPQPAVPAPGGAVVPPPNGGGSPIEQHEVVE